MRTQQQQLVFIKCLQHRTDAVLFRASQQSLRRFVEFAVQDLEQAIALLRDDQTAITLLNATRLTDLALDRIEMGEKLLRESGPDARWPA